MAAGVIVDIVLCLIIIIGAIVGIKRGFIATVAGPVKLIACIVISIGLSTTVANAVVQPIIEEPLTNQISDYLVEKFDDASADTGEIETPTVLKLAAAVLDIDIEGIDTNADYADALVEKLAVPVIHAIAVVISFILLYVVSRLLLSIIFKILNSAFDGGAVGVLNRLLGCVLSTVMSVLIAWLATSLFDFITHIPSISSAAWISEFDGGYIYEFFKNFSPIDLLLSF